MFRPVRDEILKQILFSTHIQSLTGLFLINLNDLINFQLTQFSLTFILRQLVIYSHLPYLYLVVFKEQFPIYFLMRKLGLKAVLYSNFWDLKCLTQKSS